MLTVYKASAGAGKTYHLTGEYLMLLFTHPTAYRRILAVTFTNKATDEMKIRIIEALYGIAKGSSNDHVEELCKRYGLNEKEVRKKARQILTDILHDYSAFNINTIDRFFQHTMRAFTREIGLHGGYGIEMDEELVLTEAVDRMLSELDKPENKALLGWLVRFAEDRIENGGEWNFRREIMLLSKEVFKESYKAESEEISHEISDKTTLEDYKKELHAIIRSTESEAQKLGEKGVLLMNRYGLHPSDFKGGSRSQAFYFERLAKGEMKPPTVTFITMGETAENCYTKKTPPSVCDKIHSVFDDGLGKCFTEIFALFDDLTAYTTAKEILRYYYTLGILTDVSRRITAYREEKNVMLIADTTELLNKIIDGSDAPFIY
ncbi:UvrD-helicase domain-containing protein, partial [Parabacteroides sp. OttesenSCG-928-G07]|nr:UvrD-helicase domain-containing protein [Parabacteroides sp. OttesenSCG-928-G07]